MKIRFPFARALMPLEIEAKMKLDDPAAIMAVLQQHNAIPVGEFFETNVFFDTEDRALLAGDEGLRLRVSEDLNTKASTCILTHKGPNAPGRLKSRQETELRVESAADAQRLLECLGFSRCMSFQKHRQSWRLDSCTIELDEVPHLGHFIEIEGPSEDAVMALRQRLGLSERPLIKASYIAMLSSFVQEKGLCTTSIDFPRRPTPRVARAS